jgi:hypothetical protein
LHVFYSQKPVSGFAEDTLVRSTNTGIGPCVLPRRPAMVSFH